MNDFTLDELNALVDICTRANIQDNEVLAKELQTRIAAAQAEREELESLDFEDCLSCKL